MMKLKLFALSAFTMLLAACSSNDDAEGSGPNPYKGQACMLVRVADVNDMPTPGFAPSRAAEGYEDGSGNENTITSAKFYFYDVNGAYVTTASVWSSGSTDSDKTDDIEFNGATVLVLQGLDQNSYPKYMVTVINPENDFTPANTLSGMEELLSSNKTAPTYADAIYKDGKEGDFKMSVSRSGKKGDSDNEAFGTFTTVLTPEHFVEYTAGTDPKEAASAAGAPEITVYVERLAAKVKVAMSVSDGSNKETVDDKEYYKINVTMGSVDNTDPNPSGTHEVHEATTTLYLAIDAWHLNNINKKEYMVKNVNNEWFDNAPWDGWTDRNYSTHRNYWAKSTVYNVANDALDGCFDIYTYAQIAAHTDNGTPRYCSENTSAETNLKGNVNKRSTSAIIIGKVYEKVGGKMQAVDLVDFHGIYFKPKDYYSYILDSLYGSGKFKFCKKTEKDGVTKIEQIATTDLEIVTAKAAHDANGAINTGGVLVNAKADLKDILVYTGDFKTVYTDEEIAAMKPATVKDVTIALNAFNGVIFDTNTNQYTYAVADFLYKYTGGQMYWVVPIEHLNATSNTKKNAFQASGSGDTEPGVYGVVRNHVYSLSINSLKNFGWAVFDPNEALTPNDNFDGKKYALPTSLKVLSWRIVPQSVDL